MARRKKERPARVEVVDQAALKSERHQDLFFQIRLNTIPASLGAARVPFYFGWASAEMWLANIFIAD